tara:strand:+ start:3690 stop:3914 length:225 start_codon:yes stop_codon:yes gene_type:complete
MATSQSDADKKSVSMITKVDAGGFVFTSIGGIHIYSGVGAPNHVSSKGALYVDTNAGKLYVNATGLANGWAEAT